MSESLPKARKGVSNFQVIQEKFEKNRGYEETFLEYWKGFGIQKTGFGRGFGNMRGTLEIFKIRRCRG